MQAINVHNVSQLMVSMGILATFVNYGSLYENNKPHEALAALLHKTNIKHENTLETIVKATQVEQPVGWLRKANQSRWEMTDYYAHQKKELMVDLEKLEYVQAIKPKTNNYDYVIIFGGKLEELVKRLDYVNELWSEGMRFKRLVFLAGDHPLHSSEFESLKKCFNNNDLPNTEYELAQFLYENASFAQELKKEIAVSFSKTPEKISSEGKKLIPTTQDTIQTWMKENPIKTERCLAISTQPFVKRQNEALKMVMPTTCTIETVGPNIDETAPTALVLDTLARHLYVLNQEKNK